MENSNQDTGSLTDMLLQILPHIGTVNLDGNTSTLKDLGVTDTRKFQDLRRLDASSREDDLTGGCDLVLDTLIGEANPGSNLLVVDKNLVYRGVGKDV